MTEAKYEGVRRLLEEELTAVERQLSEHGVAVDGDNVKVDVDEGFADSAQATTERGEALALAEQLRSHRAEVLGALERMDAGTYGKCEKCGQEIPVERLEALPAARLCVTCKQQAG